jgi:tetratricopeptide (TPR) repeat protein
VVAAAASLHTDVAAVYRKSGSADRASFHVAAAQRLIDLPAGSRPPDAFLRRWYFTVAVFLEGEEDLTVLTAHVQRGLKAFPKDPDLLLVDASLHEMMASARVYDRRVHSSSESTADADQWRRAQKRAELEKAATQFRRVLDIEPASIEAHLRLGRVLQLLGKTDEAIERLEAVRTQAVDRDLSYLACLFLGAVDEAAGRLDAADARYAAALAHVPNAQSALLARSQLQHRAGRREAALQAIDPLLAETRPADDPWWGYAFGQYWRLTSLLAQLRTSVRQ